MADQPGSSRTKAKAKPKSPFVGRWHIISVETWDEDYFNEEVQAFVEFDPNGTGNFQFGYVSGYMDWRVTTREREPAVKWFWEGTDGADMTPLTERAWAILKNDEVHGMTFFHGGDDSGFAAKRAEGQKRTKRK